MTQEPTNPFILRKKFPDVNSILKGSQTGSDDHHNCLFVLDANTLLAPYGLQKDGIDKIRSIYINLINSNSLYVPIHAMREFAENRSSKISDIFTTIDKALSLIPGWQNLDYPILYDLVSFKELTGFRDPFKANTKQYREYLQNLANEVINWNWQDPITKLYSEIFKNEVFIDTKESDEELLKDFNFRAENNIPPGFKDKSKSENNIGDLLIWKSILSLGKDRQVDIVFVTNDEKSDWFVRGNGKSIVTRFELVDEYYRITESRRFACMNFSSFLELQGAAPAVVNEVEIAAKRDAIKAESTPAISPQYKQQISFATGRDQLSITILTRISGQIRYFLSNSPESDNYFLNSYIKNLINNYLERPGINKDLFSIDTFKILKEINQMLKDIISVSSEIEYEYNRQKRSTQAQQVLLKLLCEGFVEMFADFINVNSF